MDQQIIDWFHKQRGIRVETLAAFNVVQEGNMINFPYPTGHKSRRDPTLDEKRLFVYDGQMDLFISPKGDRKVVFLVEGETDTLRLWQELDGSNAVFGLSGVEAWKPHYRDYFEESDRVFVILDTDSDYGTQKRSDNCWRQIKSSLGPKARRIVLPGGVKDICEFFSKYDLDVLRELCKRKATPLTRFKRLDLTKKPPAMPWLIDGLICRGDVSLFIGNPGLGKSWLMMDLALAVSGGKDTWLGKKVNSTGPVLYVDEENPEDIIYGRFKSLGITETAANSIHYLYRPGIWINKEPDLLLEEAMEIEPALIVLDSLSRLHSEDENNANAMARLFREGIVPLARETNAAVMVIHHTVKSEQSNSFNRARGSGDIGASVDAAFDCRGSDIPGRLSVSQYKSRRSISGNIFNVQIKETAEGVSLDANNDLSF